MEKIDEGIYYIPFGFDAHFEIKPGYYAKVEVPYKHQKFLTILAGPFNTEEEVRDYLEDYKKVLDESYP